jgi:hypothetical protein
MCKGPVGLGAKRTRTLDDVIIVFESVQIYNNSGLDYNLEPSLKAFNKRLALSMLVTSGNAMRSVSSFSYIFPATGFNLMKFKTRVKASL